MKKLFGLLSLVMLSACGGGGGGSSSAPPVPNASPGGIWTGVDTISGLQVTGVVDEAGEAHFIRADRVQYAGTAVVTGNSVSANFQGFTPLGTMFLDGSTHGTGTITGTVTARTSMSLTTSFKTDAGNVSNGTLDLTFEALYDSGSSLAAIAGTYTDGAGLTIMIDASGNVTGQDSTSGCTVSGSAAIIDATYDAYRATATLQNCGAASAILNGVTFTGLAALNTQVNPAQFDVAGTGSAGGTTYALTYFLTKQ